MFYIVIHTSVSGREVRPPMRLVIMAKDLIWASAIVNRTSVVRNVRRHPSRPACGGYKIGVHGYKIG